MNDIVHDFLETTIGNIFGKDITCREPVDRCDDYQPGSLIEFGRTGVKVCIFRLKTIRLRKEETEDNRESISISINSITNKRTSN